MNIFFALIFLSLLAFATSGYAQSCGSVFPDGAQNSDAAGGISINFGSQIINSPDNILDTQNLSDFSGGGSCNTSSCTASNSVVPSVDFDSFLSGQSSVNVSTFGSVTVSPGNYESLFDSGQSTITFQPGTYVFNGSFNIGYATDVIVQTSGTVRIYVRGSVFINGSTEINNVGSDRHFLLYSEGGISLQSPSTSNMLVYSKSTIFISNNVILNGALTAEGQISINSGASVTYDSSVVTSIDADGLCTSGTSAVLIHEWLFDEGSGQLANDTQGSLDFSLGSNSSSADADDPEWVCGYSGTALEFDITNTEHARTQSTFFPPEEGSVSFWFKTDGVPNGNRQRLFSHSDGWEVRYETTGKLTFDLNVTGVNNISVSNTVFNDTSKWYHVVAVYSSIDDTYAIYVDGALDASGSRTSTLQFASRFDLGRRGWSSFNEHFDGVLDQLRIYDGELTAAEVLALSNEVSASCGLNGVDNFLIDTNGSNASVCTAQEITITARDASNTTLNGYAGTIQLTTSTGNGDWSLSGSASDAAGVLVAGPANSGSAQYTFDVSGADNGQITLLLSNQQAEALTINVEDTSVSITSASTSISFAENAFVVTENDALDAHLIAARRHQFTVSVVKRDTSTGDCGIADAYTSSAIKAYISRSALDPGGAAPSINNTLSFSSVLLSNSAPSSNNIALSFSSGTANFFLDTSDVGQFSIEFLDDSLAFSDANILGSSDTLTVSPFGFNISAASNPGATDHNGSIFTTAGNAFTVNVSALGWNAAGDSNGDGIPDAYVDSDIANNTLTGSVLPSFGQEGTPETISIDSEMVLPTGSIVGLSSSAGSGDGRVVDNFSSGSGSTNEVYFSDVGIVSLTATLTDNNYLGEPSLSFTNASTPVGRFIPSYLELQSATVEAACLALLPYSYMGETFRVTARIDAYNSRDVVTGLYQGSFAKLDTSLGTFDVRAMDALAATPLSARISNTLVAGSWAAGQGTFSADVQLTRNASPDGPYSQLDLGLLVTDDDSIGFRGSALNMDSDNDASDDSVTLGQTDLRFGRLRLADRFGPETAPLAVPFLTEYWSASAWITNPDDSCTRVALNRISYPDGTIDSPGNRNVTVGSGSTTGSYTVIDGSDIRFAAGDAGHSFSAPGSGNTGSFLVNVDMTDLPWLQFDWNQDGNYTEPALPPAEYSFGSYRGHDRIIFWQEIFSAQ